MYLDVYSFASSFPFFPHQFFVHSTILSFIIYFVEDVFRNPCCRAKVEFCQLGGVISGTPYPNQVVITPHTGSSCSDSARINSYNLLENVV